ncbi:MAG: hypothetical protein H0V11_00045 [Actinobacteria bacterium]|nr:hypothetical protein [Actinomycetota bacterium]
MTGLDFVSLDRAVAGDGFEPRLSSPLCRALEGSDRVLDLSFLGKIEVRGDVDAINGDLEVVRITPQRALVLCAPEEAAALRDRLPGMVIDMTAALAGLELHGVRTLRRLTDLDLDALPAVGRVADVPCLVLRNGDSFRLFFPQEYGHSVAEVVLDVLKGLE